MRTLTKARSKPVYKTVWLTRDPEGAMFVDVFRRKPVLRPARYTKLRIWVTDDQEDSSLRTWLPSDFESCYKFLPAPGSREKVRIEL